MLYVETTRHSSSYCLSIVAMTGIGFHTEATALVVVGLLAVGLVTDVVIKCTVFLPTELTLVGAVLGIMVSSVDATI